VNKTFKKIKSYTMRYRYLLAVLVVIGALLVVSNSQLQAGFGMDNENGNFIVPGNDISIGSNEITYLSWTYTNGDLSSAGFTVYNIQRIVYGEKNIILLENTSVPAGDTITFEINGKDYEAGVIIFQLMLYKNNSAVSGDVTQDIYWDQVTVQIFEGIVPTESTTSTTTTNEGNIIGSPGEILVTLLIMLGGGLVVMVVGSVIYMKVRG
jgi:hypothetical protein